MARVSKDKKTETLKRMKEVREADSIHLRNILQEKLEWAKAERQKGLKVIEQYKEHIQLTQNQVLKLEGSIVILQQVLSAKKEDQK